MLTMNRRHASNLVDAVVPISSYLREVHMRQVYFKDVPSTTIYNIAETSALVRQESHPVMKHILTFGFIGSIVPAKGLEVILEATRRLSALNWRLRIAGSGLSAYVENLKQKYSDPRIEWIGFVASNEFYRSIDVTIISSLWAEPLGRTVFETFSAGKSAICAQSGGIPEIASFGKMVKLYPAKDVEALAHIMNGALSEVDGWREGGFKDSTASDMFSEASVISHYQQVYRG
jgi:glycosyltransferase involved in cell wall biosynthesis